MQRSEYQKEVNLQSGGFYKLPIFLFLVWLILEMLPAAVSKYLGDDAYWATYFLSEDISTVVLTLALYFSLSYTSTILKGVSLLAVIISLMMFLANTVVEYTSIPFSSTTGLFVGGTIFFTTIFLARFVHRVKRGGNIKPDHDRIYLVVSKPHNLYGMLGLFLSGVGGGFSAYVNGDCYWFPREEGKLVKTRDPDWYKGRYLIDCGIVTGDKINDLESMIGQKWSIFNNCFSVFSRWRRKWG